MAGKKGRSGRKSFVTGFREFCRGVVMDPDLQEKMKKRAQEDMDYALKLAEHGFGRPPQALDLKVAGDNLAPLALQVTMIEGAAPND